MRGTTAVLMVGVVQKVGAGRFMSGVPKVSSVRAGDNPIKYAIEAIHLFIQSQIERLMEKNKASKASIWRKIGDAFA